MPRPHGTTERGEKGWNSRTKHLQIDTRAVSNKMHLFVFCNYGYLLIFRIQTQTVGAFNTLSILFFRFSLRHPFFNGPNCKVGGVENQNIWTTRQPNRAGWRHFSPHQLLCPEPRLTRSDWNKTVILTKNWITHKIHRRRRQKCINQTNLKTGLLWSWLLQIRFYLFSVVTASLDYGFYSYLNSIVLKLVQHVERDKLLLEHF